MLLRLTIRDRLAGWAAVFYALPPLVVVMICLLSCALYAHLRQEEDTCAGKDAFGP